jgi:hypothetical protein
MSEWFLKPVYSVIILLAFTAIALETSCKKNSRAEPSQENTVVQTDSIPPLAAKPEAPLARVAVTREIQVRHLFRFLDQLVAQYDSLGTYPLTENLILRANPWILDTLIQTDYYLQKAKGNFVYDQPRMTVLRPGDTLIIPGHRQAAVLLQKMANTWLDLNIPAFEMRIMEGDNMLLSIPVRVGKNEQEFLATAGHEVDLRTRTGEGVIYRINRYPIFIDPVKGERFKFTKRDDRRSTLMPQIPWLEPVIDGKRYGQLIHPTTNPRTLGKAASNGCIGASEADAWRVYFYAPIGTKVKIRYDLTAINSTGDTLHFRDVYAPEKKKKKPKTTTAILPNHSFTAQICQCDLVF